MNDKHLNLFYSYGRGSRKDLDHLNQLEDNITRSFIITLINLGPTLQNLFLNNLLGLKLRKNTKLKYDLQNLDEDNDKKIVKKAKQKILLCISREKLNIDLNSFQQKDRDIICKIAKIKKDEKEKDKILKRIKLEYKSFFKNNKFTDEVEELNEKIGDKITEDNINDIYQLLIQKSRPDAWIFNKDIAILIEAKIGSGKVFKAQLFRHLTKSFGFNDGQIFDKDKRPQELELITTTWEKVVEELSKLKDSEKTFIKDFKEYMNMTGQTLDLSFVVNPGYDEDTAKEQFPLLLTKLDEEIKNRFNLHRGGRNLSGLWDYYGEKNNGKVGKNPHYSICFFPDKAGIILTITKNPTKTKRLIKSDVLREVLLSLCNNDDIKLDRYFIGLHTYELIDWKKGQIRGETQDTFNFIISFKKLVSSKTIVVNNIKSLLNDLYKNVKYAKQFELELRIAYPNIEKIKKADENTLRKANKELFDDYTKLIEIYLNFLQKTKPLFDLIK